MLIRQANQKRAMFVTICIFLNKEFQFQSHVCNRCHDLVIMSVNLIDIAILNIKSTDHRCIVSGISKSEVINLMRNIDLTEKKQNFIKHKFFYHI